MTKINKLCECPPKKENVPIKQTLLGDHIEIQYQSNRNQAAPITMLKGKQYVNKKTGEILDCKTAQFRTEHINSLYRSFAKIKHIILCNTTNATSAQWLTLTYGGKHRKRAENPQKLLDDFKKYISELREKTEKSIEYIMIREPSEDGTWHIHAILFFFKGSIQQDQFLNIWTYGTTDCHEVYDAKGIGLYVTNSLKNLSDESEKSVTKRSVKKTRLHLYPKGMRMYTCSRNIKKPKSSFITQEMAKELENDMEILSKDVYQIIPETDNSISLEIIIEKTLLLKHN